MHFRLLLATALLLPTLTFGSSITIHNTGVDSTDTLVAAGGQASFWTLASEPAGATETIGGNPFRYYNGAYFPDTTSAAWVAPTAAGNAGALGVYTYDLVLDLTGFNPLTASVSGTFSTDNDGSISLNGLAPVATSPFTGYGTEIAFSISSGFTAGLNTIQLQVDNGGDPTAFFVQFTSATPSPLVSGVPEPGTVLLGAIGLAALLLARSRRANFWLSNFFSSSLRLSPKS